MESSPLAGSGKRKLKLSELKTKRKKSKASGQANRDQAREQVALKPGSGDVDDFEDQFLDGAGVKPKAGGGAAAAPPAKPGAATSEPAARKARRRTGQCRKRSAAEFEASRNLATGIAECPAEEQADWLWRSFCQHTSAGSSLERDGLNPDAFAALPAGATLEARLKGVEPDWWNEFASVAGKAAGQPSVLLVSPSAMGAIHMIKACPGLNRSCRIPKLFAKHFKLEEQEALLRKERVCLAAGTPHRLCKLAEGGALRLGSLKLVVLDVHLDAKQRTILDIPEVCADWWALWQGHLKARVAGGHARVALYCGQAGGEVR